MNDDFAPYPKENGCFIVRNITKTRNKTVRIFNYPIKFNQTRDLLAIPGVSEADVRASLLKGEIRIKIQAKDIIVECSDIDLLQFNDDQKSFLKAAGVIKGLQVSQSNFEIIKKEDIQLNGIVDGVNTIFTIPFDKFIQNNTYKIIVYLNGVKQFFLDDYFVAESVIGEGYDTVIFTKPPEAVPSPADVVTADYWIYN